MGHLNLGQDVSSLRFFAICGLQEGFEPFAINMQRPVTTWFSKSLPQFEPVPPEHPHYEVRPKFTFFMCPCILSFLFSGFLLNLLCWSTYQAGADVGS